MAEIKVTSSYNDPKLGRIICNNNELLLRLEENTECLESKLRALEGSNSIVSIPVPVKEEQADGVLYQFEIQEDRFRSYLDRLDIALEMLSRII